MQIDRSTLPPAAGATPTRRPSCPLECTDCTGLCLSVYMMLTPQEKHAVYQRARIDSDFGPVGHC